MWIALAAVAAVVAWVASGPVHDPDMTREADDAAEINPYAA
jgi:cytosine/uracil/thiamine/allantoin permease